MREKIFLTSPNETLTAALSAMAGSLHGAATRLERVLRYNGSPKARATAIEVASHAAQEAAKFVAKRERFDAVVLGHQELVELLVRAVKLDNGASPSPPEAA